MMLITSADRISHILLDATGILFGATLVASFANWLLG